jgi:hypothetical protein
MAMLKHPLSGAQYRRRDDGLVEVAGPDGVDGIFNRDGNWVSGKRRFADAAMCFWVATAKDSAASVNLVLSNSRGSVTQGDHS